MMNADETLAKLMDGNARYVSGKPQEVDVARLRSETKTGQSPGAYVLSCIDSRVPVEMVFDQNVGDLFVGRVAGNVVNSDQIGSMEFAAKVVGVKVIMVMGHEGCGAVKGACDQVELGSLTELLKKISPAVDSIEATDANHLREVTKQNVRNSLAAIEEGSTLLKELVDSGELKLIGAYYSLGSGEVELLA